MTDKGLFDYEKKSSIENTANKIIVAAVVAQIVVILGVVGIVGWAIVKVVNHFAK